MSKKGYARTTVADVLRAAGVSRETFYEQFRSKEECFTAAFENAQALVLGAAAPELAPTSEAPSGMARGERALSAYLDAVAADPEYARVFLVEVYAAGPAALRRRAELQRGLVDALAATLGATTKRDRFALEVFVAATVSMVTTRLTAGDLDGLRGLREPLVELARTLPFASGAGA